MDEKRYKRALKAATEALDEEAAAVAWLKTPSVRLGGAIPEALLETDEGLQQVLTALIAIDYGLPV